MTDNISVWASWGLVLSYMAVAIWLVIRGARQTKTLQDYAVGNRRFAPWAVALSLAASTTSAATFIINPGFVALYGLSAIWAYAVVLPLAAVISLVIFTKGFHRFGQSIKALTMAQWIGTRYQSQGFALFFALLSLLLITFIVLICVGITKVLATSLQLSEPYVLTGVVIFIFGYMAFSGANSMVYTNTVQALIMIVVAFILLGSGYSYFSNGIEAFWTQLAQLDPGLSQTPYPDSPLFRDYFEIVFCQFVIGVAIICQPHIITKSLLLKSKQDINRYLSWGILVQLLFFSVVIAGLYARLSFPALQEGGNTIPMDGIIPAYVTAKFPLVLGLIVILGLISAGISTLEGLIQSLSATITGDIITPLFGRRLFKGSRSEQRKIQVNRFVILLLAIVSGLLSYDQLLHPNLSVAIFAQNGVYAYFSAAFVPVLLGTFRADTPLIAPFAAAMVAISVHFSVYYGRLGPYMQLPVRNPAIAATCAILSALLAGVVLYLIFRRRQTLSPVSAPAHVTS